MRKISQEQNVFVVVVRNVFQMIGRVFQRKEEKLGNSQSIFYQKLLENVELEVGFEVWKRF